MNVLIDAYQYCLHFFLVIGIVFNLINYSMLLQSSTRFLINKDILIMFKTWRLLQRALLAPPLRRFSTQGSSEPPLDSPQSVSLEKQASTASRKTLSEMAERALWASAIIRHIQNARYPSNITDQSLRESILSQLDTNKDVENTTSIWSTLAKDVEKEGYSLSQEVQQQFSVLFREGFQIDRTVFSQQRILQGIQGNGKFIFCPNLLVTKSVVDEVVSSVKPSLLMCGGYGVSKTISLMMIWHLTNYINTFKYHAWQRQPNFENNYAKEQRDLRKLIVKTSKFWYWTVNLAQNESNDFSFKDILLNQAVELSQESKLQLQKIESQSDFMKALSAYYTNKHLILRTSQKREWSHCLVVDQINEVTSQIRKWNEGFMSVLKALKDLKNDQNNTEDSEKLAQLRLIEKKLIRQFNDQLKNTLPKIRRYIVLVNTFIKFGKPPKTFILNSSMDIERNLLKQKQKHATNDYQDIINANRWQKDKIFLTLGLNKHQSYENYNVPYNDNFTKPWGRIDYLHFFWFEIQRRLIQLGIINNDFRSIFLKTAKDIFQYKDQDKNKNEIILKNHYRLMFCNLYLKNSNFLLLFKDVNSSTTNQKFAEKIKTLLSSFDSFNIAQSKQRVKQFLIKEKDTSQGIFAQKMFLMRLIYYLALYKASKGEQKEIMTFPADELSEILQKHVTAESLFLSKEHNHELIPVRIDRNSNTITFDWAAQDAIQILASQVSGIRQNFFSQMSSQKKKEFYKENHDALGRWVEHLILKLMQKGSSMIYYYKQYDWESKSWSKTMFRKVEIYERMTFSQFNRSKQNAEYHMKSMIKFAENNPMKLIFAAPTYDDKTHSKTSKFIDFASTQYIPDLQTVNISTFDVTLQQDLRPKFRRINQFTKTAYQPLPRQFKFTHTYFCRRDAVIPKKIKEISLHSRMNIRLAFIEDLSIQFPFSSKETLDDLEFQSVKGFIKNISHFIKKEDSVQDSDLEDQASEAQY